MKTGRHLRLQFRVCKVIDYANKLASFFLHENENVHDTALACLFNRGAENLMTQFL